MCERQICVSVCPFIRFEILIGWRAGFPGDSSSRTLPSCRKNLVSRRLTDKLVSKKKAKRVSWNFHSPRYVRARPQLTEIWSEGTKFLRLKCSWKRYCSGKSRDKLQALNTQWVKNLKWHSERWNIHLHNASCRFPTAATPSAIPVCFWNIKCLPAGPCFSLQIHRSRMSPHLSCSCCMWVGLWPSVVINQFNQQ